MRYRLRTLMRFSLWTVFIGATAFCCFLGYELDWIRQRHRFIDSPDGDYPFGVFRGSQDTSAPEGRKRPIAPQLLWLFGEQGINTISFNIEPIYVLQDASGRRFIPSSTPAIAIARRLFPESRITAWDSKTYPKGGSLPIEILD